MRLLYSQSFSASSLTFFLPKGSWGGFIISYRGNNSSPGKTRKDFGNVNLTWNGNPIINVDAELLSHLTDLKGGYVTFASVPSVSLILTIYIPAGQYGDNNNSYLVTDSDKVYFKLDYPNLSSLNGTVSIYGIPKQGVHNYFYALTSRNVVASGASVVSDVHRLPNVSQIFLKYNMLLTNVTIVKDNVTVVDGHINDIRAFSDFLNRIEYANQVQVIEIPMNLSRDIRETISQEILFKYEFNDATTLEQYFGYNILTPQQAVKSVNEIDAELRKKIEQGIIRINDIPKPTPLKVAQQEILGRPIY